MKVILLKDVARIGRKFDVKDVPDGYALNMLIPNKLAERATEAAISRLEREKALHEKDEAEAGERFKAMLDGLKNIEILVTAEANEQGSLFRAVHDDEIIAALKEKGFTVESRQIVIPEPIKTTGAHTIELSSGEYRGEITVAVAAK